MFTLLFGFIFFPIVGMASFAILLGLSYVIVGMDKRINGDRDADV